MADYVLVHGAWGGGWAYDRLASDLRAAGHRVVVAQLAGLGTRADELHPAITLTTHIDDVCGQIAAAGFHRFILAGHSYGGMIVTGVASRLGARIDALLYIDAFLPLDGQSLWDITGEWEHKAYIDGQRDRPGLVKPLPGLDRPELGRHPLLTLLEPVAVTPAWAAIARKIYIFASNWSPTPFTRFRDRVSADPDWRYHEAVSGHDVMRDQPEQLLKILLMATRS